MFSYFVTIRYFPPAGGIDRRVQKPLTMKPIIAIDLDDVLFPFAQEAIRTINVKFGYSLGYSEFTDPGWLDRTLKSLNPLAFEYLLEKIIQDPKFYVTLPPIEGAMRAVERISRSH